MRLSDLWLIILGLIVLAALIGCHTFRSGIGPFKLDAERPRVSATGWLIDINADETPSCADLKARGIFFFKQKTAYEITVDELCEM